MAETTTTETTKEEKKELKLHWEPTEFKAFGKTTRISSKDLAAKIRQQFQKTFHDCVGCFIDYTNNFQVTLFFENNMEPVPEGKIKNLANLANGSGVNKKSLLDGMRYINNKTTGKTFVINDDTKELLSDFMYGGRANKKRDWKSLVSERRVPADQFWVRGAERIIIAVTGLDINVICRELFGHRMVIDVHKTNNNYTATTRDAFYFCRFIKKMPDGSFMINIEQFDRDAVSEFNKKENPQFVQASGILMY